jgi:NADH:ubiquinone oxidoreductase subunit C
MIKNFNYILKKNKNNLNNNNIFFNKDIIILYNNLGSILLNLKKYIKSIKILNNELIIILNNNNALFFVLTFFKKHFKYQFKELVDICTVDYYINNINNRFEINYMLLSLKYKTRVRLKITCNEKSIVPSVSNIYSSAL